MKKNTNTIRSVAIEAGLSKEAIARRINTIKGFARKHTRKDPSHHNIILIDDEGVQILLDYRRAYHRSHAAEKAYRKVQGSNPEVKELKARLNENDKLLRAKDQNIEDKREELRRVHNDLVQDNVMLRNAQKLEAQTRSAKNSAAQSYEARISDQKNSYVAQISDLRHMMSLPNSGNRFHTDSGNEQNSSNNGGHNKKRGFWSRLFH